MRNLAFLSCVRHCSASEVVGGQPCAGLQNNIRDVSLRATRIRLEPGRPERHGCTQNNKSTAPLSGCQLRPVRSQNNTSTVRFADNTEQQINCPTSRAGLLSLGG